MSAGTVRTFRVLTYNIMHRLDALRSSKYFYCAPSVLKFPVRMSRIEKELLHHDPDILCLQEAEQVSLDQLSTSLGAGGYRKAVHMFNSTLPSGDGCAIFYRPEVFRLLSTQTFRFNSLLDKWFSQHMHMTGTDVQWALWRELKEKLNMAVIASFSLMPSGPVVHVVSTHLFWDPLFPDIKLLQAYILAKEVSAYCEEFAKSSPEKQPQGGCILAGDFNSVPYKVHADRYDPELPSLAARYQAPAKSGSRTLNQSLRHPPVPETHPPSSSPPSVAVARPGSPTPPSPFHVQGFSMRTTRSAADPPAEIAGSSEPTEQQGDKGRTDGDGDGVAVESESAEDVGRLYSGVYQLLTQGTVGADHPDHPVTRRHKIPMQAVPSLQVQPYRSAYREVFGQEPQFTNYTVAFKGCLDYLFFEGPDLVAVEAIKLPQEDALR